MPHQRLHFSATAPAVNTWGSYVTAGRRLRNFLVRDREGAPYLVIDAEVRFMPSPTLATEGALAIDFHGKVQRVCPLAPPRPALAHGVDANSS
ncbi:MAG: hypothetical protein ABI639_06985 [Thermoanaerobaculia bacterium]